VSSENEPFLRARKVGLGHLIPDVEAN
jgi:hypothetical protein